MKKPSSFIQRLALPTFLFVSWVLLNGSFTRGDIVFGLILAVALTWLTQFFRPLRAYAKKPLTSLLLIWHVAVDITKSNIAVGKRVLEGNRSKATPGFLRIPLTIKDPHALAAMGCIITYTPGTVWSDYAQEENIMTLHILDLQDEQAWIDTVQQRYERPLLEIFE